MNNTAVEATQDALVVEEEKIKDTEENVIVAISYKLSFAQKVYRGIKTILDFFISLVGLIVLIPVFIIVGIAIKVDSKGPVFFAHKRIGKNGKDNRCKT